MHRVVYLYLYALNLDFCTLAKLFSPFVLSSCYFSFIIIMITILKIIIKFWSFCWCFVFITLSNLYTLRINHSLFVWISVQIFKKLDCRAYMCLHAYLITCKQEDDFPNQSLLSSRALDVCAPLVAGSHGRRRSWILLTSLCRFAVCLLRPEWRERKGDGNGGRRGFD